jgi:hypothetical protein
MPITKSNLQSAISCIQVAMPQPIWLGKPTRAKREKQRIGREMKWAIAIGWRKFSSHAQTNPKSEAP